MSKHWSVISTKYQELFSGLFKEKKEKKINEQEAAAIQADLSERGKKTVLSEEDQIKNQNDVRQSYYDLWELGGITSGKCLDVGCHYGNMWEFAPKNVKIFGVNIVKEDHEIASERAKNFPNVIETTMGSMENIPYENNFFDVIYCKQTLEHSYNLKKSLPEMKRVLKNGGMLLIEVPINLGFEPAHLADIEGPPDVKERYWLKWISKYYHVKISQKKEYFFCLALQIVGVK